MKIVLASRNQKKIRELETFLAEISSDIRVLSLDDIGYGAEIEEDGGDFWENAAIKASVPASLGYIGVADDSGLAVDALDGAPGVYSARFAGEHATDEENNRRLLAAVDAVPDEARTCRFVSVVACVLPRSLWVPIPLSYRVPTRQGFNAFAVRGECEGMLLRAGRGTDGFGYDPLFYVPEKGKTFAEMSADEKNAISHRGAAMCAFGAIFSEIFKEFEEKIC